MAKCFSPFFVVKWKMYGWPNTIFIIKIQVTNLQITLQNLYLQLIFIKTQFVDI